MGYTTNSRNLQTSGSWKTLVGEERAASSVLFRDASRPGGDQLGDVTCSVFNSDFWNVLLDATDETLHFPTQSQIEQDKIWSVLKKDCVQFCTNNSKTLHFQTLLFYLVVALNRHTKEIVNNNNNNNNTSHQSGQQQPEIFKQLRNCVYIVRLVTVIFLETDSLSKLCFEGDDKQIPQSLVDSLFRFFSCSVVNLATYHVHVSLIEIAVMLFEYNSDHRHPEAAMGTNKILNAAMTKMDQEKCEILTKRLLINVIEQCDPPPGVGVLKYAMNSIMYSPSAAWTYFFPVPAEATTNTTTDTNNDSPNVNLNDDSFYEYESQRLNDPISSKDVKNSHQTKKKPNIRSYPLSNKSLTLLLVLVLASSSPSHYSDVLANLKNIKGHGLRFEAIYKYICLHVNDEKNIFFAHMLICTNKDFSSFLLSRTDIEQFIEPILKNLCITSLDLTKNTYLLCSILCQLSQDHSFNHFIHKVIIPSVVWYGEKHVHDISLGSLMIIALTHLVQYNISKCKDTFIHMISMAVLSNMSLCFFEIHSHAADRIVRLFDAMIKKFIKLGGLELENDKDTVIYYDSVHVFLNIINNCFTCDTKHNPHLVYAVMRKREMFAPLRSIGRFGSILKNIDTVLDYFSNKVEYLESDQLSYDQVFDIIKVTACQFPMSSLQGLPTLAFSYNQSLDFNYSYARLISKGDI